MNKILGATDKPIENDKDDILGVKKYTNGLGSFICQCDTPMTIAIQGDWGTGKTSFMNMVKNDIDKKIVAVWFNTWQFSQFNMGDTLAITLLVNLVTSLRPYTSQSTQTKDLLKKFTKFGLSMVSGVVENASGMKLADSLNECSDNDNMVNLITELKENFQQYINEALKTSKKDKVVVFIDDLDRLAPEKAVEILEILKIFLDCENCVFVLAIDYGVVCSGVSKKYGSQMDVDKGKSFFDKIIQVPFKMPTAHYQIEAYVSKHLATMGVSADNVKPYSDLISSSIGYNPRAMKRIFNAFLLLTMIYDEENLSIAHRQLILFAILCLQMTYEDTYNLIIADEENIFSQNVIEAIANDTDTDDTNEFYEELKKIYQNDELENAKGFLMAFCKAIVNENGTVDGERFEALGQILKISGTTANVTNTKFAGNDKIGRGVRYNQSYSADFGYRSIGELVEKTNQPSGWNGCLLKSFKIFGQEHDATKFVNVMAEALAYFYKEKPELFAAAYRDPTPFGLGALLPLGCGKKIDAPKQIPGTDMVFESKNSNNDKVKLLRKLFLAMECEPSNLMVNVKLASRIK